MTDGQPKSEPLSPLLTLVVEAGLASLYLSSLVFLAGWSYADRYFAEMGLNIAAIEGIGESNFWAYAYWVFRDAVMMILALVAAIALGLILARRKLRLPGGSVAVIAAIVLALAALPGAAKLGALRAESQIPKLFEESYAGFVRVKVFAKKDSTLADILADRNDIGASGCLRKIFMDRRNLYAYAGYESEKGPRQPILILPLSEIALVETVINPGLCQP